MRTIWWKRGDEGEEGGRHRLSIATKLWAASRNKLLILSQFLLISTKALVLHLSWNDLASLFLRSEKYIFVLFSIVLVLVLVLIVVFSYIRLARIDTIFVLLFSSFFSFLQDIRRRSFIWYALIASQLDPSILVLWAWYKLVVLSKMPYRSNFLLLLCALAHLPPEKYETE